MPDDSDKKKLERIKSYSVLRCKEKEIALCTLLGGLRKLVSEFVMTHEIKIKDVWIDDPEAYLIHLDTEFKGPGYKEKADAINELESEIQKLVGEFSEKYGVKIIDALLDDRNLIQLETNL